jgi:hypothetical protein
VIFIHLGSLRWKGLGFPGLGYQGLGFRVNSVVDEPELSHNGFLNGWVVLGHIMETVGGGSSAWHRRLHLGKGWGGGKSQRVWFLQKTNLLGEVPILAVSLSFHEKQWCHESAAASEQKKGSKFSCSSSVVSKPNQSKQASKYCALCVCVWTLWSPLQFHLQIPYSCVHLFKLFMHRFYSLLCLWKWVDRHISLTLQVCWVQSQKKKKVSLCVCVKWFH